jgi:rubrerythrin
MDQNISSPLKALNVMVEAETTVAEFYRVCSEKFTEHSTFWDSLAREEMAHAEVIRKLIELVNIQPNEFTAGKSTPLDAIKSFIARTKSNIETLQRGALPEEKALLIAYHIENTVIEAQYADVVNTENQEYTALLAQIIAETLKHKETVVGKMRDLKKARIFP